MSVEKSYTDGTIVFVCDECGEEFDTEVDDFPAALAEFRHNGGIARRDHNVGWEHFCKECGVE